MYNDKFGLVYIYIRGIVRFDIWKYVAYEFLG